MKISIKNYAKYIVYVLAVFCLIFLFIFNYKIYPLKYKNIIKKYANNYQINSYLIASVICVESSFNSSVVSHKGAIGLMQIMPQTAKWICNKKGENYNEQTLFSPEKNIDIGTYYLKYLLTKFKNQDIAIIAYNAGEGTVANWIKTEKLSLTDNTYNIQYPETANYLQKVNRAVKIYKTRI